MTKNSRVASKINEKNRKNYRRFVSNNCSMVDPYPRIQHKERILALKSKLEQQTSSKIPTNDLVKLAEFALKNYFFEFNNEIKQEN